MSLPVVYKTTPFDSVYLMRKVPISQDVGNARTQETEKNQYANDEGRRRKHVCRHKFHLITYQERGRGEETLLVEETFPKFFTGS